MAPRPRPLPNVNASLSAPDLAVAAASMKTIHHRGSHDSGIVGQQSEGSIYVPQASWTESIEGTLKLGNRSDVWDPKRFLREEQARTLGRDRRKHYLMSQRVEQYDTIANTMTDKDSVNKEAIETLTKNMAHSDGKEQVKVAKVAENKRIFREGLDEQKRDIARRDRDQRHEEAKEHAELKLRAMQQLALEMKGDEEYRGRMTDLSKELRMTADAKRQNQFSEKSGGKAEVNQTIRKLKEAEEIKTATKKQNLEAKQREMQACADMYMRTAGKAEEERNQFFEKREDRDQQRMNQRMEDHYFEREKARSQQKQAMLQGLHAQTSHAETTRGAMKSDTNQEGAAVNDAYRAYVEEEQQKALDRRAKIRANHLENIAMIEARQTREVDSLRKPLAISTMRLGSSHDAEMMKRVDASRFLHKPMGKARPPAPATPPAAPPPHLQQATAPRCLGAATLIAQDNHLKARWFDGLSSQQLRAGQAVARQRKAADARQKTDVLS